VAALLKWLSGSLALVSAAFYAAGFLALQAHLNLRYGNQGAAFPRSGECTARGSGGSQVLPRFVIVLQEGLHPPVQ
jgi:hypothetical protein